MELLAKYQKRIIKLKQISTTIITDVFGMPVKANAVRLVQGTGTTRHVMEPGSTRITHDGRLLQEGVDYEIRGGQLHMNLEPIPRDDQISVSYSSRVASSRDESPIYELGNFVPEGPFQIRNRRTYEPSAIEGIMESLQAFDRTRLLREAARAFGEQVD